MMLVGPHGQQVMLMGDAGGTSAINGVSITFADTASGPVPEPQ